MLDWFRSLFGASSDTQSKGLRKTKSMPTLTSRGTSRIAPSRGGSRHSKSTSSLKNETMMLEAQRLFVSMGLALTSTKNSKKRSEEDDDDDELAGDRSHYRNLDIIYHQYF